jgi:hypothetical protein
VTAFGPPPFSPVGSRVDPEGLKLRRIAGDLRVVGIVLAVLGLLVTLGGAGMVSGARATARLLLGAGVLVLLLPGVWFTVAASLVAGGRGGPIVRWSLRVAALQAAAAIAAVALAIFGQRGGRSDGALAIPVGLLVFFTPAQVVLLIQLVRARGLILAREERHGFALAADRGVVIAEPVMPVASPAEISSAAGDEIPTAAVVEPARAARHTDSVRVPK